MDPATDTPATDRSITPGHYWQLPTFIFGLLAVYSAYTFVPRSAHSAPGTTGSISELRATLNQADPDIGLLEPMLRNIVALQPTDTPTNFLIGSGYLLLADRSADDVPEYWTAASEAFQRCDASQLDEQQDRAKLAYRMALAHAALNVGEAEELLPILITPPPAENDNERNRLIAKTALRAKTVDRKLAKDYLAKYVGGAKREGSLLRAEAQFQLAKLHLEDQEIDQARTWLSALEESASPKIRDQSRVELAKIAMGEKNWTDAIRRFEDVLVSPQLSSSERTDVRYLLGLSLSKNGEDSAALPFLLQAAREPGPMGLAASTKVAEIRSKQNDAESRREAMAWLEQAVKQADAKPDQDQVKELRAVFETVIETSEKEGDYPTALRAATAYAKVAEGAQDLRYRAEISEKWATNLLKSDPKAALAMFADAAKNYQSLAAETSDATKQAQWNRKAAYQFRQAGEKEKAREVIGVILKSETLPAELRGQAWLDEADLLPVAQVEDIEEALKKAMALPGPAAMQARYKLAVNYIKRNRSGEAQNGANPASEKLGRDMLAQIADASTVAETDRSIHELALFELGRLAMTDRQYPEAESRLRKQLTLYPNESQADFARLWLASALLARAQADPTIASKVRAEALVHLKELSQSQDTFLKTWGEIWQANTLLQMGDRPATISLCTKLMKTHHDKLEELVIGKLLFHAYLSGPQSDTGEALKTLVRMEELFKKLPPESFRSDPEYSYQHWKAELPRLRTILVEQK